MALLLTMFVLSKALGDAVFNPANNAFLWATGKGRAREHVTRAVSAAAAAAA